MPSLVWINHSMTRLITKSREWTPTVTTVAPFWRKSDEDNAWMCLGPVARRAECSIRLKEEMVCKATEEWRCLYGEFGAEVEKIVSDGGISAPEHQREPRAGPSPPFWVARPLSSLGRACLRSRGSRGVSKLPVGRYKFWFVETGFLSDWPSSVAWLGWEWCVEEISSL